MWLNQQRTSSMERGRTLVPGAIPTVECGRTRLSGPYGRNSCSPVLNGARESRPSELGAMLSIQRGDLAQEQLTVTSDGSDSRPGIVSVSSALALPAICDVTVFTARSRSPFAPSATSWHFALPGLVPSFVTA